LRKTITDGLHPFIIIDAENCDLTYYEKFYQLGSSMGFSVFTIELFQKLEICTQQCLRNVTPDQIEESMKLLSKNRIPSSHTLLIPSALYAEYDCFMNPKLASSAQNQVSQVDDSRFNWHNRITKDLCDLLEGQSRYQRPQHISILLRGPDSHGKNQLASMIIAKEKEMRNSSVTYISIEDFFVSKSTGKFEFSPRLVDESIRNLTKQLRDIVRFKSFKFVVINVETGDFKHYKQVHELMSSYGYKCYAIEVYRDANECAENDPFKRSADQFETIIDEFKLNPTPDGHELLNASKFYRQNAPDENVKNGKFLKII
jgi:predicted kinase